MANDEYSRASGVQQPGLRSFIIYTQLPDGCFAHEVEDNRSEPHLRNTEFAIIDPNDAAPLHGDLFLIEFSGGRRSIVELRSEDMIASDGERLLAWTAYWQMEMASASGETIRTSRWGDGPYREADIALKLVGRVVGILEPDFRTRLRLT